jgi:hypothetical protein
MMGMACTESVRPADLSCSTSMLFGVEESLGLSMADV